MYIFALICSGKRRGGGVNYEWCIENYEMINQQVSNIDK
jgi:hypothetical protein